MDYQIIIRRQAEADIRDAYSYYESCRPGLGHEFLLCIEAGMNSICRAPSQYRVVHREVRRVIVHRFPFGIYFTVRNNQVVVLAVMHARRSPSVWRQRA